ncbi:UDP-N-acetylglucosamine 1-carboxyvinyltransferase [Patescibacteria group bacterium]
MSKFVVKGKIPLKGVVTVSGSKNAALPIICAALLSKEKSVLTNMPDIADIHSMIKIIESLGVKAKFENNTLEIDPKDLKNNEVPEELVKKMRASILIMGPLLARLGQVKIAFPGGCVLGKRSVDTHTSALVDLGVKVLEDKTGLHLKVKKLKGKKVILKELSVTATENAVMLAALTPGKTEIRLAATEPHVQDLCNYLKRMGAKIVGVGTNNLKIIGVRFLKGCRHKITGDYLEAGTYAIYAVATKGDVLIKGINPNQLDSFLQKLSELGAKYKVLKNSIHILPRKTLKAIKNVRTGIYPGFPTDLQAPFAVLLTQARGISKVFETLFEGRLNYLFELEKMGARVEILNPHQAIIIGPTKLKGIPISSCDIRAGAAMVVAALIADGETEISNINYIDRGYENLNKKLKALGADIERVDD